MSEPDLGQLEELEDKLVPLLERRGIEVADMQPIGLLGTGDTSSVWSLLINGKHHVLKVFKRNAFKLETGNQKKTKYPSRIVLTSRSDQNSLGFDLILSEVPPGREFNSTDLGNDWTVDQLSRHLMELHRIKRRRFVRYQLLASRLDRYHRTAMELINELFPEKAVMAEQVYQEARQHLLKHRAKFRVARSLIHNDLWWSNVIVAEGEVYLIDWEVLKTGDYLEDIVKLRVMLDYWHFNKPPKSFWKAGRDSKAANAFFERIIEVYEQELPDPSIRTRLPFYLVLQSFQYLRNFAEWRRTADIDVGPMSALVLDDLENYWKHGFRWP